MSDALLDTDELRVAVSFFLLAHPPSFSRRRVSFGGHSHQTGYVCTESLDDVVMRVCGIDSGWQDHNNALLTGFLKRSAMLVGLVPVKFGGDFRGKDVEWWNLLRDYDWTAEGEAFLHAISGCDCAQRLGVQFTDSMITELCAVALHCGQ